jgi:hypothetical protein
MEARKAGLLVGDVMLQRLLEALPDLLGGDGLQVGGGEDTVDDGRVLRMFCWEDWRPLATVLLACRPLRILCREVIAKDNLRDILRSGNLVANRIVFSYPLQSIFQKNKNCAKPSIGESCFSPPTLLLCKSEAEKVLSFPALVAPVPS